MLHSLLQFSSPQVTLTTLTFEELDAILAVIEMHDWCMLSEHLDVDVEQLYDKISEMRDEV
jgi:hypothetical protein